MEARKAPETLHLHCYDCGNDRLFLQHINYQVNLVNNQMDHVHQLESEAQAYTCEVCGAEVTPELRSGK